MRTLTTAANPMLCSIIAAAPWVKRARGRHDNSTIVPPVQEQGSAKRGGCPDHSAPFPYAGAPVRGEGRHTDVIAMCIATRRKYTATGALLYICYTWALLSWELITAVRRLSFLVPLGAFVLKDWAPRAIRGGIHCPNSLFLSFLCERSISRS